MNNNLTTALERTALENPHREKNQIKLTHYDEIKNVANDSHIVRAKENLKLSHGGPSQRQVSGTNQLIEALRQVCHWVWGLTQRRAIKEETIAKHLDWVSTRQTVVWYPYDIHVLFNFIYEHLFTYLIWSLKSGYPTILLNVQTKSP